MNLAESILLLFLAIVVFGTTFFVISFISSVNNQEILNEQVCNSGGGKWNICGSKCQIINAGKPEAYCAQVCEPFCECGTIIGLQCPSGYTCKLPLGIADAQGYCEKN